MATYAQFKHVELYKIGHGKNRVPNAPKSCIGEIFSADATDSRPMKNGNMRPRTVRDTPTRPRDTHSRLFGQAAAQPIAPMVTDTIRSHIHFGESQLKNGGSVAQSPTRANGLTNGHISASSTPSRGEPDFAEHLSYTPPKRNPVTGDGVLVRPQRRAHPGSIRGADDRLDSADPLLLPLSPKPIHRYHTAHWPPELADYYVRSALRPHLNIPLTPYTLLGLKSDDPYKTHPIVDPRSVSSEPLQLDRHWPPFPAQHYLEPKERTDLYHPLPEHAFVGMTSALGDRPQLDYKYNPVPSLDGPIDPYLIANSNPPPTLFKYSRDGPIPDLTPLQTSWTRAAPGPHTLTGFPPIFHKHVPGYLFKLDRHEEDFMSKTYFVDYVRQREMEGNPITGDGYRSMNGQINTVTSAAGNSIISHSRVPPGGYSSGLW